MPEEKIKDLQSNASLEQDDEELTDDELSGVAGGGKPKPAPTPKPKAS